MLHAKSYMGCDVFLKIAFSRWGHPRGLCISQLCKQAPGATHNCQACCLPIERTFAWTAHCNQEAHESTGAPCWYRSCRLCNMWCHVLQGMPTLPLHWLVSSMSPTFQLPQASLTPYQICWRHPYLRAHAPFVARAHYMWEAGGLAGLTASASCRPGAAEGAD